MAMARPVYPALSAGSVVKTFFVPAEKFTADPLLEEDRMVSRDSVDPDRV
jgi:hypothetical protein